MFHKVLALFALLICLTLPKGLNAQEGFNMKDLPPELMSQMSPEQIEMMKKVMENPALMNSENTQKHISAMMKMAETMQPICADKTSIMNDAKQQLREDLVERKNSNYWYESVERMTPDKKLSRAKYKRAYRECMESTASQSKDMLCNYQMPNYFIFAENNMFTEEGAQKMMKQTNKDLGIDLNQYESQAKNIGKNYETNCGAKDKETYKSLGLDKPRAGDTLLMTPTGSYLVGVREGVILGHIIEGIKSKKIQFAKIN